MNQVAFKPQTSASPDFSLMIAGLEAKLLAGQDQAQCRQILAREDIIRQLSPEQALAWAELAQLAGDVELSLKLLAGINHTAPWLTSAWFKRGELLSLLGADGQLASLLKAAEPHLDQEDRRRLTESTLPPERVRAPAVADAAAGPFQAYRDRQELLTHYLRCFSGREDCFARQWVDKTADKHGYLPVRRPITPEDLEDHLAGRKTYGIYLLRRDATVHTAVIDVDLNKSFRTAPPPKAAEIVKRERAYLFSRIQELSAGLGLAPVAEFSGGKGYHFWFLFAEPTPAGTARNLIAGIAAQTAKGLEAFNLELFPKQEAFTGKGLGNLVKLPLGIHRLTGKPSYFMACQDRDREAQLRYLASVRRSNSAEIKLPPPPRAPVIKHPAVEKEAGQYPELARLKQGCPPLAQIMAACQTRHNLSFREEKILLQTIGFLPRARLLLHYLWASRSDYDPHLLNSRISRLRGTPLGCKRIHSLMEYDGPVCALEQSGKYGHPLGLIAGWDQGQQPPSQKIVNLSDALDNLKQAILQVERFLAPQADRRIQQA